MVGNKLKYSILLVLIIFMISSVSAASYTSNGAGRWSYNNSGVYYEKWNWSSSVETKTFSYVVPNGSINFNMLLVGSGGAGGGAAGSLGSGGGGGGQVLSVANNNISPSLYGTTVSIILGSGGVPRGGRASTNTSALGITVYGGGGGGTEDSVAQYNGTTGASSGGSFASSADTYMPKPALAGYTGGFGLAVYSTGGGGGGAGGYGGNSAAGGSGVGGIGVSKTDDIEAPGGIYYGGGGSGGNTSTVITGASLGGGGYGGQNGGVGSGGIPGTGGGGGGAGPLQTTGTYGGMGVVLFSYTIGGPNVTFTSNATTPTQFSYKNIQFTLSDINSTPTTSWNWSFGDGTYSTSKNPVKYYTTTGLKTVSVNATAGLNGSFIYTRSDFINITHGNITFSSNKTTPTQYYLKPIQFTYVTNGTTPQTWNWSFGEGEGTSTAQNPIYTFQTIGSKSVSVNVSGIYGEFVNMTTNDYITLVPLPAPVISFSSNISLPQTVGDGVQFTLINVGTNTSTTSWNWSFGDGNYSTSQNPIYTYNLSGIFTVAVNGTSGINGSYVATDVNHVKVIERPNSLYYHGVYGDVINNDLGTPLADIVVRLTNSSTGWSTTTTTLTDGSFYFRNITDSIYIITITNYKYGEFRSAPFTVFGDDYLIGEIGLVPGATANPSVQQQSWYTPHVVKFTVTDRTYGTVVSGASIDINYMRNTFPAEASADWLISAYGMNATMANDMFNSLLVMSGISDSNGGAVFTLLASSGYSVRIYNTTSGLDQTVQVYPIESEYNIWITETPISNSDSTYVQIANTSLTYNAPNSTYGTFGLTYQDLSGHTTTVTFNVTCIANRTVMFSETIAGFGTSPIYSNYTVKSVRGQQWRWSYNATRV